MGDAASGPRGRKPIQLPRGVTLREFASEQRIQIAFSYRGAECRELLPPQSITQSAITYANGLRLEIRRKIADGTFVYRDYFPESPRADQFDHHGRRTPVRKLLDQQLEIYEHQVKQGTLKPSTYDGYAKAINSERMKYWDGRTVQSVTPSVLRDFVSSLDVTAKFARNLLTPLRSVFEDALNDELIEFNPFERIALTKLLKQTAKTSDYEVDPFTAAEREILVAAARADEAPLVRFWFETGLRPGELMAADWANLDWQSRRLRVVDNLVAGEIGTPKTAAGVRDVELSDEAIGALIAQKTYTFAKGGRIFHDPRKNAPWASDAQLRKSLWVPLCGRAEGVRYRNPYQVRHTYASSLLTAGHNPWYVAQQLGHVDVEMVFRTYGKFIPEDYLKPKIGSGLQRVI